MKVTLRQKIGVGTERKSIYSCSIHKKAERCQAGGTASMALGRLTSYVLDKGVDELGLGRWVWVKVGIKGGKSTYIVTAYMPCSKGIKHRRSVFQQSAR
jgi:hypothetical protein